MHVELKSTSPYNVPQRDEKYDGEEINDREEESSTEREKGRHKGEKYDREKKSTTEGRKVRLRGKGTTERKKKYDTHSMEQKGLR